MILLTYENPTMQTDLSYGFANCLMDLGSSCEVMMIYGA